MWVQVGSCDITVSLKPEDIQKLNSGDSLECAAKNRLRIDSTIKLSIDDAVKSACLEELGFHIGDVRQNLIHLCISRENYERLIREAIFNSRSGPDQVCIRYFGPENEYGKYADLG